MVDGRTYPSFPVAAALPQYTFVRINAGKLAACAAADTDGIGWTSRETFAADEKVSVILKNKQGTVTAIAAGTITQGAVCNQAASGQMQTGAGTIRRGLAMTAAAASGDWFELLPD